MSGKNTSSSFSDFLLSRKAGELLVHGDTGDGRLFLNGGLVAWICCHQLPLKLKHLVAEYYGLEIHELEDAYAHASRLALPVGEYLVRRTQLSEGDLRQVLTDHAALHWRCLMDAPGTQRYRFVPQPRRYEGRWLLHLEDIIQRAEEITHTCLQQSYKTTLLRALFRAIHEWFPNCMVVGLVHLEQESVLFPDDAALLERWKVALRIVSEKAGGVRNDTLQGLVQPANISMHGSELLLVGQEDILCLRPTGVYDGLWFGAIFRGARDINSARYAISAAFSMIANALGFEKYAAMRREVG